MARISKRRKPRPAPTTPLQALLEEHLDKLALKNYTEATLKLRRVHIEMFLKWAAERGLTEPIEITRPVLERYQRYLFHYRKKDGTPLSFSSQHGRLVPLRVWFKWMTRQNYILHNPASELELPRLGFHLPQVLTEQEAELVLQQPNVADPTGMRDRAILETLYSTGMRRIELKQIKLPELDRSNGLVTIREGKGRKDRVIPIGERAVAWIEKYLNEVRAHLVIEPDDGTVFLTSTGEPFHPNHLSAMARSYVEQAQIGKGGACHLLRHTAATLMLEGGADIRFIQQMLGHDRLTSTQIYTHVSVRMLKQIHGATHPGAHLKNGNGQKPIVPNEETWPGDPTKEELLAALAEEAAEEED
jgi:integrase/recombinase XerD